MSRKNPKLESEGAEFLVLGNLLIEGISSFKAYVNFPGYDLIAVSPKTLKSTKIQVKSRWATDYDYSFPIKNFDCDFIVHVALNRGYSGLVGGVKFPQFYVFPANVVKEAQNPNSRWGKTNIKNIANCHFYENNWKLIKDCLEEI